MAELADRVAAVFDALDAKAEQGDVSLQEAETRINHLIAQLNAAAPILQARVKELEETNQKIYAFMDGVRNEARNRNPDGATILDFFVVWNEQYEDRIRKLEVENACLRRKIRSEPRESLCYGYGDLDG